MSDSQRPATTGFFGRFNPFVEHWLKVLTESEKDVLLVLLKNSDNATGETRISVDAITARVAKRYLLGESAEAKKSRLLARRPVLRALKKLRSRGLIEQPEKSSRGGRLGVDDDGHYIGCAATRRIVIPSAKSDTGVTLNETTKGDKTGPLRVTKTSAKSDTGVTPSAYGSTKRSANNNSGFADASNGDVVVAGGVAEKLIEAGCWRRVAIKLAASTGITIEDARRIGAYVKHHKLGGGWIVTTLTDGSWREACVDDSPAGKSARFKERLRALPQRETPQQFAERVVKTL